MKKAELVEAISEKTGISKKDVTEVINSSIEVMTDALKSGDKISFIGFGSFETTSRAPRKAKVPGTTKIVDIPASKSVKFKVGKQLKDSVNK
jgi:DNA-binding protein HU-beta